MIYELLSTALLACSLGAGSYKDDPKRAVSAPYLGSYNFGIKYQSANSPYLYYFNTPNASTGDVQLSSWNTPHKVTLGYATATFTFTYDDSNKRFCNVALTIDAGEFNEERLHASFDHLQENQNYNIGKNWDINEFNYENRPEIYVYCEWNLGDFFESACTFNFPMMYGVSYETFGTLENTGVSWVAQNNNFSKTFNAIYTDDTEPKHYAFWIDKYMLSRQVRMNGDIINQNYVTALDGIDPSFGKQCSIRFTPTDDVSLKVCAVPYDPTWSLTNDYNRGYNNGYEAGKTEGQQPVSWIKTTFDGIAGFFNIQVFPFVTLGFLCFAPLIVVAIIAIVRIIKHE